MSSLPLYEAANIFSTSGFVATVFLNLTFIFLTIFHTKRIDTTYKELLIVFSILCLIFSFIEMLVHPFFHSFNGGLINFNMVKWKWLSEELITFIVVSYSGLYATIVSFFTVMFLFRYWIMMSSPLVGFFKGWKLIILISWSVVFGVFGGGTVLYCGWIDDYSHDYMRDVMLKEYNLDVDHVSGYTVIAYDQNGNLRWKSLAVTLCLMFVMGTQFLIVGICGFRMHFKMNELLKNLSEAHRKLQKQFFMSLVLQVRNIKLEQIRITSPTLTFYIPAVLILTVPFLNLEWSFPTGVIVCSFSIYPPIDSLILMLIVPEYRNAIKGSEL
nr:hypothetical protein C54F6.10 - Caenorhabditis elegans [Caenorhabditis elegans]